MFTDVDLAIGEPDVRGSRLEVFTANSTSRSRIVCSRGLRALPFRSAPADAAVAEVLGTLEVSVVDTRIAASGKHNS
ncbi:MAG: hypothetical protein WDM77_12970 [Steroidobacteraceae bacterium]